MANFRVLNHLSFFTRWVNKRLVGYNASNCKGEPKYIQQASSLAFSGFSFDLKLICYSLNKVYMWYLGEFLEWNSTWNGRNCLKLSILTRLQKSVRQSQKNSQTFHCQDSFAFKSKYSKWFGDVGRIKRISTRWNKKKKKKKKWCKELTGAELTGQ